MDEKLTLHYYSRALLMTALAPLLQCSSDGRCLSVLSGGVHSAYANYAEDPVVLMDLCTQNDHPESSSVLGSGSMII